MKLVFITVFLLALCQNGFGAKILGVFPFAAPSHYILGNALIKGLAEAGHDVTMISPFQNDKPPSNGTYRDIFLKDVFERQTNTLKKMNILENRMSTFQLFYNFLLVHSSKTSEEFLSHPYVQNLMNSGEKFDIVIVPHFMNYAMQGLAHHFNAHLVLFFNIGANSWINDLVGCPLPPSYVPDVILNYPTNMNFIQRVINTLFTFTTKLFMQFAVQPKQEEIMKKHIPGVPSLREITSNVSLVLLNSHESLSYATPHVPQMVDIGGFHVRPSKKLPKDLQQYLDNAPNGVIYFSLGSNIKSVMMPEATREMLLNEFSKLKEKVLWKWEDDHLPNKPENVKISKWLPQQDILAHPNVKLFITHGGMLSTTETVYHGKPILAIPVMGDQSANAERAKADGYALVVPFADLTADSFRKNLHEVLNNPTYAERAKLKSRIFHDRDVDPMKKAVYWVEYILRHNGAEHLRVAGKDMPWYKYHLIDVFAFIALVAVVASLIFVKICKALLSCCCCKSSDKSKGKMNKIKQQ